MGPLEKVVKWGPSGFTRVLRDIRFIVWKCRLIDIGTGRLLNERGRLLTMPIKHRNSVSIEKFLLRSKQ